MNGNLKRWGGIIFLLLLITSVIYGIADQRRAKQELKNCDSVVAIVTEKIPGRSSSSIYVKYTYRGAQMHSDFVDGSGSFEVGDKVLLKIAKRYPQRYISVIRTIK